ncbi:MAG: divergent polysaccharide deacetylase family protein [Alphaproteobacteria bacterium]|nr:divergent polysaccharide deacetylase family protein [Alphaproteobacteria bacterium]
MAKRSKKASGKPTGKSTKAKRAALLGALPLAATAAALLLGGLGIGLFIGTQMRPGTPPVRVSTTPPAQIHAGPRVVPIPPAAPALPQEAPTPAAPAPILPLPPEHNAEAAEDTPTPAPPRRDPKAEARPKAEAPRPQLAVASLPKPPMAFTGSTPPWRANAVAPPATHGKPMVALVLDDMGLDRKRAARAIALPGPLTLSFLPYAEDLPHQTQSARTNGHELMVHVPMEPLGSENPGPRPLTVGLSSEEVAARLDHDLSRFAGFVGINNHMGSKFTGNAPGMAVVIGELRARGLLWLDSRTAGGSVGSAIARAYDVPHVDRDVFLDNNPALPAVQRQLADLEAVAKRRGWAVAIGHPKDGTLDALAAWLPRLAERGVVLVPLSHIVRSSTTTAGGGAGAGAG